MKRLAFITLVNIVSFCPISAVEYRDVHDDYIAIMGFEENATERWEEAIKNTSGYNSCLLRIVNDSVICTYFKESVSCAKDLWQRGHIKPVAQSFLYDKSSPLVWSHNVYIGKLKTGDNGYIFTYDERVRIDNVKYDQIRVGTAFNDQKLGSVYFLDKFK